MTTTFLTTFLLPPIPYVNAAPHIGFALEAVQADVLARHRRRQRGEAVRLLSGTDDNSLKNVLAAEAAGVEGAGVRRCERRPVRRSGRSVVAQLRRFHPDQPRPAAPRRRRGAVARVRGGRRPIPGDLDGLYCVGCEHYLTPDELDPAGHCPDHRLRRSTSPSATGSSGCPAMPSASRTRSRPAKLRITPPARRNEVLAFIRTAGCATSPSRDPRCGRGAGAFRCPAIRIR